MSNNVTNPYTFTNNPTVSGKSICNTDVLNEDIMYLKYRFDNETPNSLFDLVQKDHELSFADSEGFAKLGTYVYKNGQTGVHYGYEEFYNRCISEYNAATSQTVTRYSQSNITPVGNLGNNKGVLFRFSSSSYATFPNIFAPGANDTWETVIKMKTGSKWAAIQWLISPSAAYKGFVLGLTTAGKLFTYISSNGKSWNIASNKVSSTALKLNTEYYVKFTFDGEKYELSHSTDNTTWTADLSIKNVNPVSNDGVYRIGVSYADKTPWLGRVDLNGSYIKVNNSTFWQGTSTSSYTIKKHNNGHVFYDISQKSVIDAIYEETGTAWLYGVDTSNQRIFLPRNDYFFKNDTPGKNIEAGLPDLDLMLRVNGTNAETEGADASLGNDGLIGASNSGADEYLINQEYVVPVQRIAYLDKDIAYGNSNTVEPPAVGVVVYMIVGTPSLMTAIADINIAKNEAIVDLVLTQSSLLNGMDDKYDDISDSMDALITPYINQMNTLADNAATSATNAATSETNAATSATNAATSETNALNASQEAQDALEQTNAVKNDAIDILTNQQEICEAALVQKGVEVAEDLQDAADTIMAAVEAKGTEVTGAINNLTDQYEETLEGLVEEAQEAITTGLAPATENQLGGIKVGSGLSITNDGTLSADVQDQYDDTELRQALTNKLNLDLSNINAAGLEFLSQYGGGVPPQPITGATVSIENGVFKLKWTDPGDISVSNYDFYKWQKTVIIAKVGGYPTSPTDGTQICEETTRNSYTSTALSWTPQTYDNYYFKAFVYATSGYYSKDASNEFAGLAPEAVTNPLTHKTSTGYQLKWNDPTYTSNSSWACTYIIRKENAYPESIEDGTQVLKSLVRNQYSSNPYTDIVPDATKNYYYRAFTYSTNNLYNSDVSQKFTALTPSAATDCFVDKTSHAKPELIWQDPADYDFCTWAKTVIVRKEGSAPANATDGTVIYTETTRNAHNDNTNPYIDTTADLSKTYYYKAFPCSTNGVYNTASPVFEYGSIYTQIYEFIINTAESDPTAAVTYAGANANFTPASMNFTTGAINYGSWASAFFQPRPVMVKYDGTVDYELSKNDFTKKADGVTASDVSNTSYDGNCMIAFPQVWMKFVQDDSTHQHVYIADSQIDNDYHCYTHQNKNGTWLDEIFIMAFEPSNISNKLRSLADQDILRNLSGETMQTYAKANGSSWDFMDYGELQMLQMLCVLMFKSLDTQSKIGAGVVHSNNTDTTYETTGSTKDKGMFYAICNDPNSASATTAIKVFGIENLWGNHYKWINGLVIPKLSSSTSNRVVKYKLCDYTTDGTTVTTYSQDGTGYKTLTNGYTSDKSGFINKLTLNSDGLFADPANVSGSSTTYVPDFAVFTGFTNGNYFAFFGGTYYGGDYAGLFYVSVDYRLTYSINRVGASLSCKPL